jgi:hypothetical protein
VNDAGFVRWFGSYCSESRGGTHALPADQPMTDYGEFTASLTTEDLIAQSPAVRFLFASVDDTALLFVDGNSYATSPAFASTVADNRSITAQQLIESVNCDADQAAALELYNRGYLIIE